MKVLLALMAFAAMASAASAQTLTDLHGYIVDVDSRHDLVLIHHRAHAGMEMDMTMAVKLRDPRQLRTLTKGRLVTLRCDTRQNPYLCTRR